LSSRISFTTELENVPKLRNSKTTKSTMTRWRKGSRGKPKEEGPTPGSEGKLSDIAEFWGADFKTGKKRHNANQLGAIVRTFKKSRPVE